MGIENVVTLSIFAGLATAVGGFLSSLLPVHRRGCLGMVLGFAGGVMIGLSLFGLMPEAYFQCRSILRVSFGFICGILMMWALSSLGLNTGDIKGDKNYRKLGYFIALGIAVHNFPEGVAMGVGFQGGTDLGFMIAFAMTLHNVPEGIGIGAPLKKGGLSLASIVILTAMAGLVTPIGAIIGWKLASISIGALGIAMGFAAGAMIYISFAELLREQGKWSDLGIFLGILLTFALS
ncbi:MAG TPA: ZIP family metal transporter [Firmicutes bacterium]|nr:ZIP family metal transporter [Bacillota bacterium]